MTVLVETSDTSILRGSDSESLSHNGGFLELNSALHVAHGYANATAETHTSLERITLQLGAQLVADVSVLSMGCTVRAPIEPGRQCSRAAEILTMCGGNTTAVGE